jgi:hypothetical protein
MRAWGVPVVLALAVAAIATGCTGPVTDPAPEPTASGNRTPGPVANAQNAPTGDAEADLAFFDATNSALYAADEKSTAREYAEALVVAGFSAADIAFSADTTAIGLEREAIEFAVRDGEDCLVGQVGSWGYRSAVVAPIATGACLIGEPLTLD